MKNYVFALIFCWSSNIFANVEFFCWNSENAPAQAVRIDASKVICNYMVVCEPVTDSFKKKIESVVPSKKYADLTDEERTLAIQSPFLNTPTPLGKISNLYCKGLIMSEVAKCPDLRQCQLEVMDIFFVDPPQPGMPTGRTIKKNIRSVR